MNLYKFIQNSSNDWILESFVETLNDSEDYELNSLDCIVENYDC